MGNDKTEETFDVLSNRVVAIFPKVKSVGFRDCGDVLYHDGASTSLINLIKKPETGGVK